MSNVAQNLDTRPSEVPEPPKSERTPRVRKARKPSPSVSTGLRPKSDSPAPGSEAWHRRRVSDRLRGEALEQARHTYAYRSLVNDMAADSITSVSLPAVVARAVGNCDGDDLLSALLEEMRTRSQTLSAVCVADDVDAFDRLEMLERELKMLERRAEVAIELVHRCGLRELTDGDRALLLGDDGAECDLSHAAEE